MISTTHSNNSSYRSRASNRTYQRPSETQWHRMSRAEKELDMEKRKADQMIARANKQRYDDNQANWHKRNLLSNSSWQNERDRQLKQPPAQRHNHFHQSNVFKPTTPVIAANPFAGLDSDSDSDSDSEPEVKDVTGPTLPSQKTTLQMDKSAVTWAGFRENPVAKSSPQPTPTVPVTKKPTSCTKPKPTDWADSDSEDEIAFNDAWDSD